MDQGMPADRDASDPDTKHRTRNGDTMADTAGDSMSVRVPVQDECDADRPAKRRRIDEPRSVSGSASTSRAASPPWKSFSAAGPTTVFENGVRKSSRVNRDAGPPAKTKTKTTTLKTPLTPKKTTTPLTPKTTLNTAKTRTPNTATTTTTTKTAKTQDPAPAPAPVPAPRLRLKLRRLDPPMRHPLHAPPPSLFGSLHAFLAHDDPLDPDDPHRMTDDRAAEEARRRIRIEHAATSGVLSQAVCSVFAPEPAPEPPQHYAHWDHVTAHALHLGRLLVDEKKNHRRLAKMLAREAQDKWAAKYRRKTKDELDQDDLDRHITRYKQLVRDLKNAWTLVRAEIDKERVAKYEEEQLQLGHKAMDDMFNHAQDLLARPVADSPEYYTDDDGDDDDTHHNDMQHGDDSDDSDDMAHDDDANLTADQLRAKYEQLPDLPDSSSDDEDDEDQGTPHSLHVDDDDEEQGTPHPLHVDDDASVEADALAPRTNGWHVEQDDYINPANVELEQVDDALLDSDDDLSDSGSGSEEWPSDEEEDDEDAEHGTGASDHGTDDEDGHGGEDGDGDEDEDEDEDDVGLMGFLGPSDIKKLKAAAKTSIEEAGFEHVQADMDQVFEECQTNGVHGEKQTNGVQENRINGVHREHHTNRVLKESQTNGVHQEHTNGMSQDHTNGMSQDHTNGMSQDHTNGVDGHTSDDTDHITSTVNPPPRETSSPPRAEIPPLLRGTLREYQHGGLDWLSNLYDTDTNGILADEMGLGKTIQTISLLAYIACFRNVWGPHLVVVPTSVMLNWEMEFKKFLPGFKILTYYGDINERKRKRMGWRNTGKDMYNVVITSYQLILQDAAAFKMRAWHYLILDEAHNIKNFKSQRWQTMLTLRTERRLLLTGTPLQNNIDELWSLLYFLMPAGFAGEGRIANLEEFTLALKNPTSQILDQGRQQLDAEAQKIVARLHEVLRPYLLRRLKSEVEKQMPGKYEHVVYCKLSKRQRQLYDGFMSRADTKHILSSGNYMSIINCLMSLRKVCNHPDLFETRAIVTSMAMPKSVAAEFEIKDLLIRKRLCEGVEEKQVNLDALNMVFARREHTQLRHARRSQQIRATRPLEDLIERQTRRINKPPPAGASSLQTTLSALARREQVAVRHHLQRCLALTRARTQFLPVYGKEVIDAVTVDWHAYTFGPRRAGIKILKPKPMNSYYPMPQTLHPHPMPPYSAPPPNSANHQFGHSTTIIPPNEDEQQYDVIRRYHGDLGFRSPKSTRAANEWCMEQVTHLLDMIPTLEQRAEALQPLIAQFTCVTPAVAAEELAPLTLSKRGVQLIRASDMAHQRDPFHDARMRQSIAFPDKRLLQYDCGKLQRLATLLRDLQAGGHRVLIFTQMTKVLDILEQFLNIHGHRYLRLDGSTKVEQRQILTDRFNTDTSILAFILSSRSGGLGINLTGADTVVFYDLDWNPAMDKQCQDRAHRIGQTRDVHIYKFVSEYTIEANILRKSNQKRLLDDVIIQKGDFTTDTFNRASWRDALDDGNAAIDTADEAGAAMDRVLGERAGILGDARVMNTVEDTEDRHAASVAHKEMVDEQQHDHVDFSESHTATPAAAASAAAAAAAADDADADRRHVDEYMLALYRAEFGAEPWRPPTERRRNRKGVDPHVRQRKRKY